MTPDVPTRPVDPNGALAAELRAVAARKNISRGAIAAKLDVSAMWVSRRFTGQTELTLTDVARICEALDVDPHDVLCASA